MLHTTDEMKKLEQRLRKEQRRNRIIAKIIKSTYRSDFFEGKECEFDNPNSTLDLFMVIDEESYLLGPISDIVKKKKRKKEYWTIKSYLGTLQFEIISQPVVIKVRRKNQILFDIRNMIRNFQEFNKKRLHLPLINKLSDSLVSQIENYLNKKSPILDFFNNEVKASNKNNTKACIEADSDKIITSNDYRVI